MKHSIEEQVKQIATRAAEENNLELVHTELSGTNKNSIIRVYIDKEGGVTHEDCALVSKKIGDDLDEQDTVALSYTLEVSSPGLERGLYSLGDFLKFSGHLAKVKTQKSINGQKNFRGRIIAIDNQEIIFDDRTNGKVSFPFAAVAKANLEIDFEEELKRSGG